MSAAEVFAPEENHSNIEPVPLDKVFITAAQARREAEAALMDTTIEINPLQGEIWADVDLEPEDFDPSSVTDIEMEDGFSKPIDEIQIRQDHRQAVGNRIEEQASEYVIKALLSDATWYLWQPDLARNIENGGQLQQFIEFIDGDQRTALLNLSKRQLSEQEIEDIRTVLQSVSQRTNGLSSQLAKYIVVQDPEYLISEASQADSNLDTLGQTIHSRGLIRLNSLIFDREKATETDEQLPNLTAAQATLTHELYHLFSDGTDHGADTSNFSQALGWGYVDESDVLNPSEELGQPPDKTWVYRNGQYLKVPTQSLVGDQEVKPTSKYGSEESGEDAAEAFVPYVHYSAETGGSDVDAVRRNALDNKVRNIISAQGRPEGPRFVESVVHDPAEADFGHPQTGKTFRVRPILTWRPESEIEPQDPR